ncbi:MAG: hypothetical protein H7230_01180 [Candidatus Parcubacteria bacterium]|nr:hypothetical protein [Candidatus Paceibacterota bacterium]
MRINNGEINGVLTPYFYLNLDAVAVFIPTYDFPEAKTQTVELRLSNGDQVKFEANQKKVSGLNFNLRALVALEQHFNK